MSAVRRLRAVVVWTATVCLVLASITAGLRLAVPVGVPPPAGEPVPDIDINAHGRPADQLLQWASQRAPALRMPVAALQAYAYAAKVAQIVNPPCHLGWTTLAGIGMVESKHGTFRGATIAPNGDVTPHIRGARLDGSGGNQRIPDPSATGTEDGFAQAMGPMQIIPETWRLYGVDAHNDGISSPDNIDDAALSAAGYLCYLGKDLSTRTGWMTAILAYNRSTVYAGVVRDWATAYAAGHPLRGHFT
jgi:membrane-bound lytic murein transglycosylase B